MKPIVFSKHAKAQLKDRGATEEEVQQAIELGEQVEAKKGRIGFRKNFVFENSWKNKYYETKQVLAIVVNEPLRYIVVTIIVYYFGGKK